MYSAGFLAMCSEDKRLESGMKDLSILLLPELRRRICPCQYPRSCQRAEVHARLRRPLKHNSLAYHWATLLADCSVHGE